MRVFVLGLALAPWAACGLQPLPPQRASIASHHALHRRTLPRVLSAPAEGSEGSGLPPSWEDLLLRPGRVADRGTWAALGPLKRLALASRLSVTHLTLTAASVPCLVAAVAAAAAREGANGVTNSVWASAAGPFAAAAAPWVWVATALLWHLSHNMINDAQDTWGQLDTDPDSFRRRYGSHVLAEGLCSPREFYTMLGGFSLAALAGTLLLSFAVAPGCAWVFPLGLISTVLYTPVAKPLALGEVLVFFVWGALMYGGGWSACVNRFEVGPTLVTSIPVALAGFTTVLGKHLDKREECARKQVRVLPVVLGDVASRTLGAAAMVAMHVSTAALVATKALPPGALLSLAAVPMELRHALKGYAAKAPESPPVERMRGSLFSFQPALTWPIWYVALAGWHAVTHGYLLMGGLTLNWLFIKVAVASALR